MPKIKVMLVFGTRPEAIKMCPLVEELNKNDAFESLVCVTAQHREILDQVLDIFQIVPDYDLDIMRKGQTLSSVTNAVLEGMEKVLSETKPDIVLVHGDTSTAFTCALAAFYAQTRVGHVEAGLRTYNKFSPFPEEMNRTLISRLADLHFAPTENNAAALRAENITQNIFVTGNTVIDAFSTTVRSNYVFHRAELNQIDYINNRVILVTAHRRENLGRPMEDICDALLELCGRYSDIQVVFPVHPNPAVRDVVMKKLGAHSNVIHLIEPVDVQDMHNLMTRCYMVMTDSGGLQEEAPHFGKPVVVLRTETERPEAVEAGTAVVAGVAKDNILETAELIITNQSVYDKMAQAVNPYGDGYASGRIAKHILEYFQLGKE